MNARIHIHRVEIGLQPIDRRIDPLAEGDAIEFVEHGLGEAFDDAVGLRALRLGAYMVDVLDREIQLHVPLGGCRNIRFRDPLARVAVECRAPRRRG